MHNAKEYAKSNHLQKRDALEMLRKYSIKINWKNYNAKIIDIGSGDGSVTTNILHKFLPDNYSKLVGCDININMVNFANKHHGSRNIYFIILDIEEEIPDNLKNSFDHAFSFYALHWINNIQKTFENIYNLLTEEGDCLLMFLGYMPIHDIYHILSCNEKWSARLKNVKRIFSPYHDSQQPEIEVEKILRTVGFSSIHVICQQKTFIFNSVDALKNMLTAIVPFDIPNDIIKEYLDDFVAIIIEGKVCDMTINSLENPPQIVMNYKLLTAYSSKL